MTIGTPIIISAPSGAGKTSLVKALLDILPKLQVSISYTTRPKRVGELEGIDYYFVDQKKYDDLQAQGSFLEHAEVFGHYYATQQETVLQQLKTGNDVLFEIDWQGAQQIRSKLPQAVSIFILPPSLDILHQRLCTRKQDGPEVIARRMQRAKDELSHYPEFDYLVVNDDFTQALEELKMIILSQRCKLERQKEHLAGLLANLLA